MQWESFKMLGDAVKNSQLREFGIWNHKESWLIIWYA
jgi:hypothetical protein